jgi:peptide/nickel transport system substrate-binding protein
MASHVIPEGKSARFLAAGMLLVVATLLLSACGNTTTSSGPKILTAIGFVGGTYTQNMSPYSPNVNVGIDGLVYENLVYVNGVTGQETPMLATSHSFNADNTQLTFTIRQGVNWSDGKPFTADDVVFTFNMLKQYPGADGNGIWQHLSSVTKTDPNTVVMTFKAAYPPLLPFIEQTYIVPQHIWSSAGDPTKFVNPNPVGTGPMMLKSGGFTAQLITYVKNPNYWQADKVKVDQLNYLAVSSNDVALEKMASHQADWTGIFNSALQSAFVDKDSTHNHVYMVPVVPAQLVPNLKNPLLSQLAVRQAISAALDRHQMSVAGESGLEPPASPTGLMPGQEAYLDPSFGGTLPSYGGPDAGKADQILQGAGFTKGADGIYADAQGNKLSFKVTVPADFSDYVQDLQIAQQNLQAAGIDLQLNKVSDDDWRSARASGSFDLIMTGGYFGPTPWYYYDPLLNSAHINQGANTTNWEGWNDPATDQLLNQYATSSDPNVQKQALQGISKIMADKLPVITLLDAIQFFEYTTVKWTGWPTPDNPYAIGSAYPLAAGDNEQVILHLTPA